MFKKPVVEAGAINIREKVVGWFAPKGVKIKLGGEFRCAVGMGAAEFGQV
jgi:hypothetical protein